MLHVTDKEIKRRKSKSAIKVAEIVNFKLSL